MQTNVAICSHAPLRIHVIGSQRSVRIAPPSLPPPSLPPHHSDPATRDFQSSIQQLWRGLHWGDQKETGDETEGTPRCLQEGDDGEICCSGACVGESPSNRLLGDHSAGPWQRTGAVGEGGPSHPDDTLRGALQPGWRTGSPWLLDCCDKEAGREEQSSPTFDLQ